MKKIFLSGLKNGIFRNSIAGYGAALASSLIFISVTPKFFKLFLGFQLFGIIAGGV
jgi:hypothetical protein